MYTLKLRTSDLTTIGTLTVCCALLLGAVPGTAEAGVCSTVGSSAGCVRTRDVRNNNLRARDLNDEGGADFATPADVTLSVLATVQVIGTMTVRAPRSGVIIANASGWFDMGLLQRRVVCGLSLDGTLPTSPQIQEDNENTGNITDDDEAFALTRGFPVSRGTRTVFLVCREESNVGSSVRGVALTAMYFPTRY